MLASQLTTMLVVVVLALWLGVSGMAANSADDHVCYFNNTNPYRHYSTKTLYDDVRNQQPPQEQMAPGCQPSLLYLMVRHGSRFPSDDDIELMQTLLPQLRDQIVQAFNRGSSNLCSEDISRLKTWRLRITMADASQLAPVGYEEMASLAERFQTRFPGLLKRSYSESEVRVRSTYKDRTLDSAKGFLEGLYNRTDIEPTFLPKGQDRILRFYDSCKRYKDELDDAPIPEYQKFLSGPVYNRMISRVEARLGFPQDNLTADALYAMYRMCVFDHVLYSDAPWCAVFSESDLRVVEYSEDLDNYYSHSYGAPKLAMDQTCELMKDFFGHLRNGSSSSYSGPRAILRFAHSSDVQTFMSALGLYSGDVTLTANNMADQTNRRWQTSLVGPFSANLGFAMYTCNDNNEAKIQAFVNEKPVVLPGCTENVCEYSKVFKTRKTFADTCNFDRICIKLAAGSSPLTTSTAPVCLSLFLLLTGLWL